MKTREEKMKELRDKVGDDALVDELLASAGSTEKDAQKMGLAYKEVGDDTTEKAKKPAKGKAEEPPADEADSAASADDESAEDPEEEATETPEEEDAEDAEEPDETETPAAKKKKKEFSEQTIGDMTMGGFAELVSGALAVALKPYLAAVKEMREDVDALKEHSNTATTKERQATKEVSDKLGAFEKRLGALEGEIPVALKEGYRASQDDNTVVQDGDERLKEANMPHADSGLAGFMNFLNPQDGGNQ
jgi:hypothetical protein